MLITIIYIIIFWLVLPFVLIFTSISLDKYFGLVGIESTTIRILGIFISVIAGALLIYSIRQFRKIGKTLPISATPPKMLINRGIFSLWRHPIYLFYTIFFLGAALYLSSAGMLLIVLPVFVIGVYVYIIIEEYFLSKRFGPVYAYYKKNTSLIIPRLPQLLKIPLWIVFKLLFNYRVVNKKRIHVQSQFFMLATHRNYLDPFFIGIPVDLPVNYVTTFEMFRKSFSALVFRKLLCIPKKRYLEDSRAVRNIINILNSGGVVGIFPEGERSWTGKTAIFKPEVIKLLKKYHHIPVLPVRIDGNYHAWPRWGRFIRRAAVTVTYGKPFYVDRDDPPAVIESKLKKIISPKDDQTISKSMKTVLDLPKVVYRCPVCLNFDQIVVNGPSHLSCSGCKTVYTLQNNYTLKYAIDGMEVSKTINEIYQDIMVGSGDIAGIISTGEVSGPQVDSVIHRTDRVSVYAEQSRRMEKILDGVCRLTMKNLCFSNQQKSCRIKLDHISAATVEGSNKLQLYEAHQGQLYQIIFSQDSVLKWQDFICRTIEDKYDYIPDRQ